MSYIPVHFISALKRGKPLAYFQSKSVPSNIMLKHVVRYSNDREIISYYMDKLPHDDALSTGILYGKFEIVEFLLANNVTYDPARLRFCTPGSIKWAKQYGIDVKIEQCSWCYFSLEPLKALLSYYPNMLNDIDLCKCGVNVASYILANYDVTITPQLVKRVLKYHSLECLKLIISKINLRDYLQEIGMSWLETVEYVLHNSDITITDLGMTLFTGPDTKKKIKAYSSQVPDFVTKARECNLLQMVIDSDSSKGALHLIQEYEMCVNGLSLVDSAKHVMYKEIDALLEDGAIIEESYDTYKDNVNKAESISDVANIYKNIMTQG